MNLPKKSLYEIANDTMANAEYLSKCTDIQRVMLDNINIGNMDNDAVPTCIANSYATVNGALFGPAPADSAALYYTGTSFVAASDAPNETEYVICLVPDETVATFAIMVMPQWGWDNDKHGFYVVNTQIRVFGTCTKSAEGVFPSNEKRRLFYQKSIEDFIQIYPNGLEITPRRVKGCHYLPTAWTPLSSNTVHEYSSSTSETLGEFEVNFSCYIHLNIDFETTTAVASYGIKTYASALFGVQCYDVTENVWRNLGSDTYTPGNFIKIHPGKYRITIIVDVGEQWNGDEYFWGTARLNAYNVNVSHVVGTKMGDC